MTKIAQSNRERFSTVLKTYVISIMTYLENTTFIIRSKNIQFLRYVTCPIHISKTLVAN